MNLNEVINGLLGEMRKISGSDTVVGKPIEAGDTLIVPVCKLSIGFGTGQVEGKGTGGDRAEGSLEGGGAGGGISMEPLAFVVVGKDGNAQLLSLKETKQSNLSRAIELVPDVVDRIVGRSPQQIAASKEEGEKGGSSGKGSSKKS